MVRKVLGVTGIRSEYDILYSPFKCIEESSDLELAVIVTGAHLSETFGYTECEIIKDGFQIVDRIESLLDSDSQSSRAKSASITLQGMIQTISRVQPDLILVAGDREEVIVSAIAGVYMNIPVAHIAGGDYGGLHVDDLVRDATTKLAHLHFVATQGHFERVISLAEERWRINLVGAPSLDRFIETKSMTRLDLQEKLNLELGLQINSDPFLLVIQHVLPAERAEAADQMRTTLESIKELQLPTLVGYPNSDSGGREIIHVIDEFMDQLPFAKTYKNLPRTLFVNILRHAGVIVGNSTTGIHEAPFFQLPAVNVGNRQKRRDHGSNVLFTSHDPKEITQAIRKALFDVEFKKKLKSSHATFGDGTAGKQITDVLTKVDINNNLMFKKRL